MDGDDVERRGGLRFQDEASAAVGIGQSELGTQLDSDETFEARVAGFVDAAMPPSPIFRGG